MDQFAIQLTNRTVVKGGTVETLAIHIDIAFVVRAISDDAFCFVGLRQPFYLAAGCLQTE
jgi:hypothetical protein